MTTTTPGDGTELGREDYLARIAADAALLADAVTRSGPASAIPTCPDWTIRELVHHQGEVHRWATVIVRDALAKPSAVPDDFLGALPDDDHLVSWFGDGAARLVDALRAAPDDLQCFTFLSDAPRPVLFWARRQAHETGMHRVDAESAGGSITPFLARFAADGIDELLTGFVPRKHTPLHAESPVSLAVALTDAPGNWHLTISDGVGVTVRESKPADCSVTGAASDVHLALWNRQGVEPLTITGDAGVLAHFRESVHITWK